MTLGLKTSTKNTSPPQITYLHELRIIKITKQMEKEILARKCRIPKRLEKKTNVSHVCLRSYPSLQTESSRNPQNCLFSLFDVHVVSRLWTPVPMTHQKPVWVDSSYSRGHFPRPETVRAILVGVEPNGFLNSSVALSRSTVADERTFTFGTLNIFSVFCTRKKFTQAPLQGFLGLSGSPFSLSLSLLYLL